MIKFQRCTSENPDFVGLVQLLDKDLAQRDGEEHEFYHQFNSIKDLKNVVLAFEDGKAVSCGAFKVIGDNQVEIKRMYSLQRFRGRGMASSVLAELEKWAKELGFSFCRLETGIRQPEAIALYQKNGYSSIANYGQYIGVENSRCFEKSLKR